MREPGWTPRNDRRPVDVAAFVHRDGGPRMPVIVTDLTDEGCRLSGEETLRIGEEIRVEIPHVGYLTAQIRWALEGEAGARFCGDDPS